MFYEDLKANKHYLEVNVYVPLVCKYNGIMKMIVYYCIKYVISLNLKSPFYHKQSKKYFDK